MNSQTLSINEYFDLFGSVLEMEAKAIMTAKEQLSSKSIKDLLTIYELLIKTGGRLVFCGVGKSANIAQKISSTFCSLGLGSFFLHPTDALHGDLGNLNKLDVLVLISKSGTTEEIVKLLPFLPIKENMMIGLLGNTDSILAEKCSIVFDCSVDKEACVNNQAPTTSSTTTLAMGDAMAVIYEKFIGLSKEDFAFNHPGGVLGKSLRLKVEDIMIAKKNCPILGPNSTLKDVLLKMTEINLGICIILNELDHLEGIVVEGDIRRALIQNIDVNISVKKIMNAHPVSISPNDLAFEALKLMENRPQQISVLPVLLQGNFCGVLRLHDLLKQGLFFKK